VRREGEAGVLEVMMWIGIIGGFFVLRLVAATIFFFLILPEGVRCPNCDAETLRVQAKGWNFLMPKFRTSWCYECGWDGLLRHQPHEPVANSLIHPGQLPVSSKKSSK
jgi:hypothetical protein